MDTSDVLTFSGLFVLAALAALVGYLVVRAVRRWMQRDDAVPTFTFQDLRDMRASGQITDREFAAMRNVLLSQLQTDLPPEPAARPSPDDSTSHPT